MKRRSLVLTVAMLVAVDTAYCKGVPFPEKSRCFSPHKSWEVICRQDKLHEGEFRLLLRDVKNGTEKGLFEGDRWCEVLWQEDESHIVITDWGGSNFAEILVQDLNQSGPARPLQDLINMTTIRANVSQDEFQGHCYWEALSWERNGRLRFRIFGHTDAAHSREFSHMFLTKLPGGAVTALKSRGPNQSGANGRQPVGLEINRTPAASASGH